MSGFLASPSALGGRSSIPFLPIFENRVLPWLTQSSFYQCPLSMMPLFPFYTGHCQTPLQFLKLFGRAADVQLYSFTIAVCFSQALYRILWVECKHYQAQPCTGDPHPTSFTEVFVCGLRGLALEPALRKFFGVQDRCS